MHWIKRTAITAGISLSALLGSSVQAQSPAPVDAATSPEPADKLDEACLAKPTYPARAQRMEKQGKVMLQCFITPEGRMRDCTVLSEDPVGYAFGETALGMTCRFKMKPFTKDGEPVGGASVKIPLNFTLRD